jgi:poly-gamma-glutamate capsule biosynthesis protein CapA/YwtB (metallophosphatase superfamily)
VLDDAVRLFLGGDVMLGRGVDQILAHRGDPTLCERSVRDARTYVELAEAVNGPIPCPSTTHGRGVTPWRSSTASSPTYGW